MKDFKTGDTEAKFPQNPPMKTQKVFIGAQVLLRIVTIGATLASAWIMFTSKQSINIGDFALDARYSYSPEFKFLVYANLIACGFSLLSLLFIFFVGRQSSNPLYYFCLFINDLVMMCLSLAGCAATTAIGFLGKYGNRHTGWMPICDHFGKFCSEITTSVALSYLSMICLMMLTVISASKSRQIQV